MELLLNTQEERCRMEVYNEYLRKIPQLLTQLEAVEKMYEKAVLSSSICAFSAKISPHCWRMSAIRVRHCSRVDARRRA